MEEMTGCYMWFFLFFHIVDLFIVLYYMYLEHEHSVGSGDGTIQPPHSNG